MMLKDIINTEARFNNRHRGSGWLTPTANQLLQTLLHGVDQIRKILPVSDWTVEANKFAFMKMEDGTVRGIDFQNGTLKGFRSVYEYINSIQEGMCAVCEKPIEHHHHIVPRSQGGSDTPDNIIGLCSECHHAVHTGEMELQEQGLKKKYAHLSALNQVIPYFIDALIERFGEGHVHLVEGYETRFQRELLGLTKDHHTDAISIASIGAGLDDIRYDNDCYEIRQFRRQDRAIINNQRERTYKLNGQTVAKNRKPREEQKYPALSQWFKERVQAVGRKQAEKERGQLKTVPAFRRYNIAGRISPGATFLYRDKRYVMTGQMTNGQYYRAAGAGSRNFPAKQCKLLTHNTGLVYL